MLPAKFTSKGSIQLNRTKHLTNNYMTDTFFATSNCGLCAHYSPQGRRGGNCQQLNALVESKWDACPLFANPFALKKYIIGEAEQLLETAMQTVGR
jgi:hypothetical protein